LSVNCLVTSSNALLRSRTTLFASFWKTKSIAQQ
jgi:hypothetical protein